MEYSKADRRCFVTLSSPFQQNPRVMMPLPLFKSAVESVSRLRNPIFHLTPRVLH